MTLAAGTHLGHFEVVAPLGAGGMGEVFRARDTRLGREVAIKALPAAFAQDPERAARFEREAKLLASLNHPNIGGIHGLEEVDGVRYLVLEFIDGETLDRRLSRGALPVGEALDVCRQIATAVEAAHESGVVHRDLKPGNVMLTEAGIVKVLDFGLAKAAASGSPSDPNLSASPTMTYAVTATAAGVILGTAAYMSPEQARGKAVDRRTDIWSFGCVLYECLTSRRCFDGETTSDLIASILQGEPDWNALPAQTPVRVRELLRRCLDKDTRRRLRDIGDARIEIEEAIAQRTSSASGVAAAAAAADARMAAPRRAWALGALAGAAVALVAAFAWQAAHRAPAAGATRFEIASTDAMRIVNDPGSLALSPDGMQIAFVASDSTHSQLWVRPLGALAARALAGTDGGFLPFWSPDGQSIGFFTDTKLKRLPAAGGDVQELCDVKRARGGTWSRDGVIVYAPTSDGPLFRIAATGGDPQRVTSLDSTKHESGHRFPEFLPDGRHVLFTVLPSKDDRYDIDCVRLDGGGREHVTSLPSGVHYAAPGWLLYQRRGAITAERFDLGTRRTRGTALSLRDALQPTGFAGSAGFAVASNGTIAYGPVISVLARMSWLGTEGRPDGSVPVPAGPYRSAKVSPDGMRAVLEKLDASGQVQLWLCDLERGTLSRLSDDSEFEPGDAHWSPDGSRVAYLLGSKSIVVRAVNGATPPERYLVDDPAFKDLSSWTQDGQYLVYSRQDPATRMDLWLLPMTGDHKPRQYYASSYSDNGGSVTADGRWMVIGSDETGKNEGYALAFPVPGAKTQITVGDDLYAGVLRGTNRVTVASGRSDVTVRVADVMLGPEFRLGPWRPFATVPGDRLDVTVAAAANRALLLRPVGAAPRASIGVVMNWPAALPTK